MAPTLPPGNASGFRAPSRFITTHDENGTSTYLSADILSPDAPWIQASANTCFHVPFGTTSSPAQMSNDADVHAYVSGAVRPADVVTPNGTNVRMYDFAPGFATAMHRTYSIDYAVVIEGTVEGVMDGGEVRTGRRGDVFVQRGTNHLWRNPSETEWARMCFFVAAAEPVLVGGREMEVIEVDHSKGGKK